MPTNLFSPIEFPSAHQSSPSLSKPMNPKIENELREKQTFIAQTLEALSSQPNISSLNPI